MGLLFGSNEEQAAASYKSPYRKCAGVMLHRLTRRFRAGALVDRELSTGHPFGVVV
jgi:hypothetical protein